MEEEEKEFLLKEYDSCRDFIKFNIELHQNLIRFYITIVSIVSVSIVGIYKFLGKEESANLGNVAHTLLPFFYVVLAFGLCLFLFHVFSRVKTTQYVRSINQIRARFLKDKMPDDYLEYMALDRKKPESVSLWGTDTVYFLMIATLNTSVFALIFYALENNLSFYDICLWSIIPPLLVQCIFYYLFLWFALDRLPTEGTKRVKWKWVKKLFWLIAFLVSFPLIIILLHWIRR